MRIPHTKTSLKNKASSNCFFYLRLQKLNIQFFAGMELFCSDRCTSTTNSKTTASLTPDQLPLPKLTISFAKISKCFFLWLVIALYYNKIFSHGLVGHRKTDNRQDFKNPLIVAYYGVDYIKNPKGTNYWRNRILKVAEQYKDKINFAISSKDDFQHELNEFGIDFVKGEKPVIVARNANNQKFIMKDDFRLSVNFRFYSQNDLIFYFFIFFQR